jgi:hypothetical protein
MPELWNQSWAGSMKMQRKNEEMRICAYFVPATTLLLHILFLQPRWIIRNDVSDECLVDRYLSWI